MSSINFRRNHQGAACNPQAKTLSLVQTSSRMASSPRKYHEYLCPHFLSQWSEVEEVLKDFTAPSPTCPRTAEEFKQQWRQVLDCLEKFSDLSPPKAEDDLQSQQACEAERTFNQLAAAAAVGPFIPISEPVPSADHEGDSAKSRLTYLRDLYGIETPWRRTDSHFN